MLTNNIVYHILLFVKVFLKEFETVSIRNIAIWVELPTDSRHHYFREFSTDAA